MPDDNLYFLKKLIAAKASADAILNKPSKLCEHVKYSQIVGSMLVNDLNLLLTQVSLVRSSIGAILDEEIECRHRDPIVRKAIKVRLSKMAMIGQHLFHLRQELEDELLRFRLLIKDGEPSG